MGSQVCSCSKIRRGPILIPLGCEWKGNHPDCEDIITTTPNIIGETIVETTTMDPTTTSAPVTSNQNSVNKIDTSFHRFSGIKDDFIESMMRGLMTTTTATTAKGTTTSWVSDPSGNEQEIEPATTFIPTTLYTTFPTTTSFQSTAKPIILPKTMRPETLIPIFDSRMRGAMRYPIDRLPIQSIEPPTTTKVTTTTSTTTTTTSTTSMTTTSLEPVTEFKLLDPSTTTTQAPPILESADQLSHSSVNRSSPVIKWSEVSQQDSFTEEDSSPTIALEAIQTTLDEFSPEKVNQLKRFIQAFESELKHEAQINADSQIDEAENRENTSKADRKAARKMAKSAKKSKEKITAPEIEFCEELDIPENGFLTYSNERRDSSTAIYHCHDGFEIKQRGADRNRAHDP